MRSEKTPLTLNEASTKWSRKNAQILKSQASMDEKQILEPQVRTLHANKKEIRRKKRFKGFLPRLWEKKPQNTKMDFGRIWKWWSLPPWVSRAKWREWRSKFWFLERKWWKMMQGYRCVQLKSLNDHSVSHVGRANTCHK